MQCRRCGTKNRRKQRFCGDCGALLQPNWEQTASVLAALETSVPDELAVRILQSRSAIQSELKQVTVLFADISQSTQMVEKLGPEEADQRIYSILKIIIDAVHENEGLVNRIHGDGLMALFGAPIALEDHALRACHAALSMQEAIMQIPAQDTRIRVGLNSGQVLVRAIYNDLSIDYDAVGATVHLASRMEEIAKPGSIYLTENTAQFAEGFLEVTSLGEKEIKGLPRAVEVFQLTGLVSTKSRWDIRATQGLTELVGRDMEMDALKRALAESQSNGGQVVAIIGEPGIGKSRLIHELVNSDSCASWTVLSSAAAPHEMHTAYYAISRLLRSWFEIKLSDEPDVVAKKVETGIINLGSDLDQYLPAVRSLLDLKVEDEGWKKLDPLQRRRDIREATTAITRAQSRVQQVLIVIEDLHWLDSESETVLVSLAECAEVNRVLLLLTYRPEYDNNWLGRTGVSRIQLDPLNIKASVQLLTSLIGESIELEPLKQELVLQSGGTPLFLEEMVRSLIDTGTIEGSLPTMRLTRDVKEINIPATVQSIIAARIDRLAPPQKSLLQLASVIGKDVPKEILLPMANVTDKGLNSLLGELQMLGFLVNTRISRPDLFSFKHELTREVTYDGILTKRRRKLHRQVVETIESRYVDRLEEHVDRLAYHALRGALWEKAADYHIRACLRAILRSAHRQIVVLLEGGVKALTMLPTSTKREKNAIDIRLMANTALIALGELEHMIHNLREAEAFAKHIDDKRRLALVKIWLSIAQFLKGNHAQSLEAGKAALAIANKIGRPELQFSASANIGMAYHGTGDYDRAIKYHSGLHKVLIGDARYKRDGWAAYPIVLINTFLASSLIEIGQFDNARTYIEEACNFSEDVNHPYSQAMILDYHGYFFLNQGLLAEAIDIFEGALALCREYQIFNLYRSIAAKLAMAYARSGKAGEAISLLEPAINPADYLKGGTYVWLWLYLGLGEAKLAAGQTEEALRYVIKGVELTRSSGERPHLAYAMKLLGSVHEQQGGGHLQLAENDYRDALELAESCGMRPLTGHCHRALGALYLKMDLNEVSQEHMDLSSSIYSELGLNRFIK